jgi:phosphoribosylformylglycinamidine (FGAM) synthase-like enzyme/phosphoribosylformylglycinamidine (FGAM) synthase PurS component
VSTLRFEVARAGDPRERLVMDGAAALGLELGGVEVSDLYWVTGLDAASARRLIVEGVLDPVTDRLIFDNLANQDIEGATEVEVALRPGVTDLLAEALAEAAQLLGLEVSPAVNFSTGRRYRIAAPRVTAERLARELLMNPIIERCAVGSRLTPVMARPRAASAGPHGQAQLGDVTLEAATHIATLPVRNLDDAGLIALSGLRRLALDLAEMRAIAAHFRDRGRDPTELELEMIAQTWSEHCVHKTFRAKIRSVERETDGRVMVHEVDGLLSMLRRVTDTLDRPWVRSAFVDNAGIVALTDTLDIAIKVETHNHPSALEPFGGANTGVGGVIRDILGVSGRPIANLDVLCFGPQDGPGPSGVLHPRRIREGVIRGVGDYGNKMGIPTVTGAILHHAGYARNPLVFCGCVGVLPHGAHPTGAKQGDLVVVLGGRTGRDGLRGATFSSLAMDGETATLSGGAVQLGHPLAQKQLMEVLLEARDAGLYHAVTDCGAGGLSSAVGELARDLGAYVELGNVRLKYAGLAAWEIWLSESQERMVLAVPPAHWPQLQALTEAHRSEVTAIGQFGHRDPRDETCVEVVHEGVQVGLLETRFLAEGLPRRVLEARWDPAPPAPEPPAEDLADGLARRLEARRAVARTAVLRRYDHEVGGGTVLGPLQGDIPTDAAVLAPLEVRGASRLVPPRRQADTERVRPTSLRQAAASLDTPSREVTNSTPSAEPDRPRSPLEALAASNHSISKYLEHQSFSAGSWTGPADLTPSASALDKTPGLALAVSLDPELGLVDPYCMAWAVIDEAVARVVATGADPDRVALLDNFAWGDPRLPDRLGALVRAVRGCHDAALHYGTPFVSGKDSLNNEWTDEALVRHPIPPTLVITALGVLPDGDLTVGPSFVADGDILYLTGITSDHPTAFPDPGAPRRYAALHTAMRAGLVRACRSVGRAGVAVTLAEMAAPRALGAHVVLDTAPGCRTLRADRRAFCASPGRHLVVIAPSHTTEFEATLRGHHCVRIGTVVASPHHSLDGVETPSV